MGLSNSLDIFQERMSGLMADLDYVRAYIDDLLCISKRDWDDHIEKLDAIFARLQKACLRINANKSVFGKSELEYLGYWITCEGIQPITKKLEAIQKIVAPTTKKELCSFIDMVNLLR